MQKNAVVTGGSKGIGFAIVQKLLEEGFRVFVASRSEGNLTGLAQKYGGKLVFISADFSQRNAIDAFAAKVVENTESIDILVNNAGVFKPGSVRHEEEGVFEELMQLNIAAPYHLTRKLLPLILKHKDSYIFNMCSTASIMAYINGGSYCISKHALLGFSKVLREELKDEGIAVSSILPGATYTDSWSGSGFPAERFIKPEAIAEVLWTAWMNRSSMVMEEILLRPVLGDL